MNGEMTAKLYAAGSLYEHPRAGGITVVLASDYDRLRAENEALRSNYYRLCLWAIDRRPDLPDHSCVECVPNSDLIIRDYRCAYHTAKTWAALAAGSK
jgi:hypothetical protein